MKIAIRRGKASTAASAEDTDASAPGSTHGFGAATAVLDAPEEMYAPEPERVASWPGGGPAPAGALQRGFTAGGAEDEAGDGSGSMPDEDSPYVPRRGSRYARLRSLPRSVGGRVVLGCVVFGALGSVALALAGVRYFLVHDDRFLLSSSRDIQVSGDQHLTRSQVLGVFGADLERNIFRVSLAERRADLERLPWVAHATVMRLLPNEIRVAITERVPVAFVRQGSRIGLVDAGGVLLDMPPEDAGDPKYSFPVLTGLSAADAPEVRAGRMEVYKRFMQEMDGAGEHLTGQVSEVDVANPEDVKALLAVGGTDILVHFGSDKFVERFKEFQQHLPEWRSQYPKLASADMRYEGQIVLEMEQGAGVPVNGDGAVAQPAADAAPSGAAPSAAAPSVAAKTNAGDAAGVAVRGGSVGGASGGVKVKAKAKVVKKAAAKKGAAKAAPKAKAGAAKTSAGLVTP